MEWMTITLFLLAIEANAALLAASAAIPEPLEVDELQAGPAPGACRAGATGGVAKLPGS